MLKGIRNYFRRREAFKTEQKHRANRSVNFHKMLDEIVYCTCKNRQAKQIDKYGTCFSHETIEKIQFEAKCTIWSYLSDAQVIQKVIDLVARHECDLEAGTPASIIEYGI